MPAPGYRVISPELGGRTGWLARVVGIDHLDRLRPTAHGLDVCTRGLYREVHGEVGIGWHRECRSVGRHRADVDRREDVAGAVTYHRARWNANLEPRNGGRGEHRLARGGGGNRDGALRVELGQVDRLIDLQCLSGSHREVAEVAAVKGAGAIGCGSFDHQGGVASGDVCQQKIAGGIRDRARVADGQRDTCQRLAVDAPHRAGHRRDAVRCGRQGSTMGGLAIAQLPEVFPHRAGERRRVVPAASPLLGSNEPIFAVTARSCRGGHCWALTSWARRWQRRWRSTLPVGSGGLRARRLGHHAQRCSGWLTCRSSLSRDQRCRAEGHRRERYRLTQFVGRPFDEQ